MMDIITGSHDTVKSTLTKNFVYEYSSSLNGIGTVIQGLMAQKSINFASYYDSRIGAAKSRMDELWEMYINNTV